MMKVCRVLDAWLTLKFIDVLCHVLSIFFPGSSAMQPVCTQVREIERDVGS